MILSKHSSEKIPVYAHKVNEERTVNDCLLKFKQRKDNRDKKDDTKKSTNKKELITDYFSQMNDSKNNVAIQKRYLKGKQFITDYFKPISNDQELKETVKEICDLERKLKKSEDESFKIKSKLEETSKVNEVSTNNFQKVKQLQKRLLKQSLS